MISYCKFDSLMISDFGNNAEDPLLAPLCKTVQRIDQNFYPWKM